ncbi:MAG: phosphatase [Lachnospiraceae bacterium]|nr:phosphatase [Lachnospiraceae bacterium]
MRNVLDSHAHTIASGHAYNTVYEMAQAAAAKGLELLALTEHSMKMPGTCHEFYFMNLKVLPRQMFGIEVLFGTEVNIMDFDGSLDMRQELLEKMDVVVASMHTPCIKPGTAAENTRAYVRAIENPAVNIIGHPDDGRYPVNYEELVAAAKEHHVLLELNNSSLNPAGSRKDPVPNDKKMLELCRQYEAPIIINSDCHCAADVGNHQYADELLKEIDFPEHLIVNRSVEEYKKYINRFTLLK